MGNILDYIDWRGDITFAERPFNDVDNLILSELAYINMKDLIADDEYITLQQLYERWTKSDNKPNIPLNDPTELFKKAASSIRFRNIKAGRFSEIINTEKQLQFAAVTFMPGDGSAYISFRGTDDTLVGWREDCNLSFLAETPGQKEAVKYINAIAKQTSCLMRIGGHSKGGNFAVYGAAFCDKNIRERLIAVYSNDGPGFNSTIEKTEEYITIIPKVKKIVPESSLVGILLLGAEKRSVVKSTAKGIYQHHPYTWCVLGEDFIRTKKLSVESALMDEALRQWLGNLSNEEKKLFVNSVFDSLEASGASTLDELNKNKLVSYNAILKAGAEFPAEKRAEIFRILKSFARASGEVFFNEAKKIFEKALDVKQLLPDKHDK